MKKLKQRTPYLKWMVSMSRSIRMAVLGVKNPEKISQSFQLDRSTALFLVHLLRARVWNLIVKLSLIGGDFYAL